MYFSADSSLDPKNDNRFDRKVVSDSRKNINNEVLIKKKAFPCTQCNRSYDYEYGLKNHLPRHSEVRQHKCACGKQFKWKQGLSHHMKTVHNPSQHNCGECGDKFTVKSSLTRHIRSVHKGEKPFVCQKCCQAFTTNRSLKYHLTNVKCI